MDGEDRAPILHWNGRKWRNRLHWQFDMTWLGEDAHGAWLAVPAGTVVRRGRDDAFRLPDGFVSVVPPHAWWTAEFYTTHPELEVYVNVGTPAEWLPGSIRQVDLDLDVVRRRSGSVQTLDEDEFAAHQVAYRYPHELMHDARRAADEVTDMLQRRVEPFDRASLPWLERGLG